jgi:hypothetical protein
MGLGSLKQGKWVTLFLFGTAMGATPAPCAAKVLPSGIRPPTKSQFLRDAARYLIGSEDDAEAVYRSYKKRVGPHDLKLPFPAVKPAIDVPDDLNTFWKAISLDQEVFTDPPTHKWQVSKSGDWMRRLIPKSGVKAKPRLIYRRRAQSKKPLVALAQTWDSSEPARANNRETEVAIKRSASEDYDFFVYDKDGKLTVESTFATRSGADINGPAPVTCLTCHYNRRTRRFTNIPASFVFADGLDAGDKD